MKQPIIISSKQADICRGLGIPLEVYAQALLDLRYKAQRAGYRMIWLKKKRK